MTRLLAFLAAAVLLASAAPARASIAPATETFDFAGTCGDCTGTVSAQLVLDGSYTLGTDIGDDFVSFTYDGSNLYPGGFTVTEADVENNDGFVSGSIGPTLPGEYQVFVSGGSAPTLFSSGTSGFWCVYSGCQADYGEDGIWSQPNAAPEPASIAMFGAGLVALGARRRAGRRG